MVSRRKKRSKSWIRQVYDVVSDAGKEVHDGFVMVDDVYERYTKLVDWLKEQSKNDDFKGNELDYFVMFSIECVKQDLFDVMEKIDYGSDWSKLDSSSMFTNIGFKLNIPVLWLEEKFGDEKDKVSYYFSDIEKLKEMREDELDWVMFKSGEFHVDEVVEDKVDKSGQYTIKGGVKKVKYAGYVMVVLAITVIDSWWWMFWFMLIGVGLIYGCDWLEEKFNWFLETER